MPSWPPLDPMKYSLKCVAFSCLDLRNMLIIRAMLIIRLHLRLSYLCAIVSASTNLCCGSHAFGKEGRLHLLFRRSTFGGSSFKPMRTLRALQGSWGPFNALKGHSNALTGLIRPLRALRDLQGTHKSLKRPLRALWGPYKGLLRPL